RAIWIFGAITVVSVGLPPDGAVLQSDYCPARQPAKTAVDPSHKNIQFGAFSTGSSFLFRFLFGDLAVTLKPGIELLQLVRRKLAQACGLEFFRRHHFLDAARRFRFRRTYCFDARQHQAKSNGYAPEQRTARNLHDGKTKAGDSRMLPPGAI